MTESLSGGEIYDNFLDSVGTERIVASAQLVGYLSERHQKRAEWLRILNTRMENAWQGAAAGAARRGLGPLIAAHEQSAQALRTAQDLTSRQSGSFERAKNDVVPVPPEPGEVNPLLVLARPETAVTHYAQVAEYSRAAQHNVDVMNGYTNASTYNTENQPADYGSVATERSGVSVDDGESTRDGEPRAPRPRDAGAVTEPVVAPRRDDVAAPQDGGPGQPRTVTGGGTVIAGTAPGGDVGPRGGDTGPRGGADGPSGSTTAAHHDGPGGRHGNAVTPRGNALTPRGSGHAPRGSGDAPRAIAGVPRANGAAGEILRGRVVGAEPGPAGRAGPGGVATGPGRGGTGFGGLPVGGGGGRKTEDAERRTPAYLTGEDDPEDLFDTDQLTAPPTIGDEDD